MKKMFLRSQFNYDVDEASLESALICADPSLAKQSFKEETDINTIVNKFMKTGELPENVRMPTYDDFTGVYDFKTAMDAVAEARESFDAMPALVRARFDNDPAKFVDFCSDDKNRDEAKELGLLTPKELAQKAVEKTTEKGEVKAPEKGEPVT